MLIFTRIFFVIFIILLFKSSFGLKNRIRTGILLILIEVLELGLGIGVDFDYLGWMQGVNGLGVE